MQAGVAQPKVRRGGESSPRLRPRSYALIGAVNATAVSVRCGWLTALQSSHLLQAAGAKCKKQDCLIAVRCALNRQHNVIVICSLSSVGETAEQ